MPPRPALPTSAPTSAHAVRRGWRRLQIALALLLGLAALPVFAQTGGTPPPVKQPPTTGQAPARSGGGMGVGVQVDVGQLFQLGRRLLAAPETPEAYLPGALLVAFPVEAGLDPASLAAETGAQLTSQARLDDLGLMVAQLQTTPEQVATMQQALQARHPELTADRAPWWYPQQDGPALPGSRPGRLYAAALLGIAGDPPPLPKPVRVALIDGLADPAVGLQLAGLQRLDLAGDAADPGLHATDIACLLACRARGPEGRRFAGLAPGIELLDAAVLASDPQDRVRARPLDVLRALDWSLRQGAQVVNVSLGAAPDAVTALAFRRAMPRLAAVVAAAGNGGPEAAPPYPAALPGVIAVAAVDARARPWRDGNRGRYITLAAPGVELWVPSPGREDGRYRSGTSFAAPLVTAWIAQRLARGLPVDAASLCTRARDLPPPGPDPQTGCGLPLWPAAGR
ncbi:S8 family serine peptidase [Thermomonas flagellata]|uniref:S8 family serine peptidase n=1 Tax=Thermomonas flagellata TaxID=2888524 RepID=UPI001F042419|nr:S8 family serine peptidase [Thermomonas flagellata]